MSEAPEYDDTIEVSRADIGPAWITASDGQIRDYARLFFMMILLTEFRDANPLSCAIRAAVAPVRIVDQPVPGSVFKNASPAALLARITPEQRNYLLNNPVDTPEEKLCLN